MPEQRRICERMLALDISAAWMIDDVSRPKDSKDSQMSAGVAPQRLSSLPADIPTADLARLFKGRGRIDHDYREPNHALGLDHCAGRSWPGRHHHVTS